MKRCNGNATQTRNKRWTNSNLVSIFKVYFRETNADELLDKQSKFGELHISGNGM
jgi:hypothetical protein